MVSKRIKLKKQKKTPKRYTILYIVIDIVIDINDS